MVYTSQREEQTGTLHIDICDDPQSPHPPDVTHGKYVRIRERVRDDADRIGNGDIVVDLLSGAKLASVPNDVTEICSLGDHIVPNTWLRRRFYGYSETNFTVELVCHESDLRT
jgi:hypothetical protein